MLYRDRANNIVRDCSCALTQVLVFLSFRSFSFCSVSPFKRKECGPSNFDASTSSRLIAFLRARNFLLAHLTSTKKLRWTDESISWDSDFLSLAIGTALAERRMMNCGQRMMDAAIVVLFFFHDRTSSLSLFLACSIERLGQRRSLIISESWPHDE